MLASRVCIASRRIMAVSQRSFLTRTLPVLADKKDLPYHLVMGLPALSPTMETGVLAEWYVQEGDKFSAGDAIAKIETDKASIDFEAQDDAYVAKILVEAGSGNDIKCGTPILITVDEEADVAAFKDYELPAQAETPAPAAAKVEEPVKEAEAPAPVTPEPVKAAPPAAAAAPTPSPPPKEAPSVATASVAPPPKATPSAPSSFRPTMNPASALRKSLGKSQQSYIDRFGTTGQQPV
ncbi:hypothetical protein MPSEU_001054300 [Mayamaea pseudoterrestris]|nr:hypothetical protein MPSEU_001054300 [Mayamaea pseudoterrestris]